MSKWNEVEQRWIAQRATRALRAKNIPIADYNDSRLESHLMAAAAQAVGQLQPERRFPLGAKPPAWLVREVREMDRAARGEPSRHPADVLELKYELPPPPEPTFFAPFRAESIALPDDLCIVPREDFAAIRAALERLGERGIGGPGRGERGDRFVAVVGCGGEGNVPGADDTVEEFAGEPDPADLADHHLVCVGPKAARAYVDRLLRAGCTVRRVADAAEAGRVAGRLG